MMRQLLAFAFALTLFAGALSGHEATAACTVPNTLTNGTTADATQVMTNFNAVATCTSDADNLTSGSVAAAQMSTNLSAAVDSAFGSTQGSILYRGASGWVALAPGTAGQVLSTNGAGANPSWVPQSGGGGGGLPPFYVNPQAIYGNGNGGPAVVWQALWLEVGDTVSGGAVILDGSGTVTLGAALYGPGASLSGLPLVASGTLTSTSVTSGNMYKLGFSSTFTATTAGLYWLGVYQDISINMYTSGVDVGGYTGGSVSSWPSTAPALSASSNSSTVWGYR
jgi:hypothetical protein